MIYRTNMKICIQKYPRRGTRRPTTVHTTFSYVTYFINLNEGDIVCALTAVYHRIHIVFHNHQKTQ